MTLRRYSAWLAIGFAPVLLLQTAMRHWGEWSGWIVADIVAAAFLAAAGARTLREGSEAAARWLAGAWGFASATLWISLFALIPYWSDAEDPHEGRGLWIVVAGWLLVTGLTGLAGALAENRNARR